MSRKEFKQGGIVLLAVFLLLVSAFESRAQIGYSRTVADLALAGQETTDFAFKQDALGGVFAVWITDTDVWAARRAPGTRVWGASVPLRRPGGPAGQPYNAAIAVDDLGNATVVWRRATGIGFAEGLIEYARFVADPVGEWTHSAAVPGAVNALYPEVVIDHLSRVTVVWHQLTAAFIFELKSAQFTTSPSGWGSVRDVGVAFSIASGGERKLIVDADGRVTVIWAWVANNDQWAVRVARNDPTADLWGATGTLASGFGSFASDAKLALDVSGNVLAAWSQPEGASTRMYFSRFDKAAGVWSPPRDIPGTLGASRTRFAPLPNGDFLGAWSAPIGAADGVARASRYQLSTDQWLPAVDLSTAADDVGVGDLETDALGNAFATWAHIDAEAGVAQTARYHAGTQSWSAAVDLGEIGEDGHDVQAAVNPAGNAVFGWEFDDDLTVERPQWTEWLANPPAPTITGIASGNGALSISFTPPLTSDAAFAPTEYEYTLENLLGLGWIGGSPSFTGSPITAMSLSNGQIYSIRVRARNRGGAGLPSASVSGTPGIAGLQAPSDLRVDSIVGNTVTLRWTTVVGSIAPTAFVVEGGVTPAETLGSVPTGGESTGVTFTAPTGAFYVRVHAISGAARSVASNEIRIFVNVPPPPDPPRNLTGVAVGSLLQLGWENGSGSPQAMVLSVTGSTTMSIALPGSAQSFSYASVPDGLYTFTVRARNSVGVSAASNPVTLNFPGPCSPPGAASGLASSVSAGVVTLSWNGPTSGGSASAYRIEAGSAPGLSNLAVLDRASTTTTFTTPAPAGTYYVRVRALNACGAGAPSAETTVVVL